MRVTTLLVTLFILKALGPFLDNFAVLANDAVAERIQVRVQDLPEPFETPSASNGPIIIERPPAANLRVPAGFKVNPFAEDLKRPRWMAIAPNGDVFLTAYESDEIMVLRDSDDDGTADVRSVYLSGLHHPHGLAFHGGYLYIGETTQIRRVRYKNGALETSELVETVTPKGSLGDGKGHWTRNIVFAPDGSHFYVAVGSRTNRDAEDPPRASVQRFASDGSDQSTFAVVCGILSASPFTPTPATCMSSSMSVTVWAMVWSRTTSHMFKRVVSMAGPLLIWVLGQTPSTKGNISTLWRGP